MSLLRWKSQRSLVKDLVEVEIDVPGPKVWINDTLKNDKSITLTSLLRYIKKLFSWRPTDIFGINKDIISVDVKIDSMTKLIVHKNGSLGMTETNSQTSSREAFRCMFSKGNMFSNICRQSSYFEKKKKKWIMSIERNTPLEHPTFTKKRSSVGCHIIWWDLEIYKCLFVLQPYQYESIVMDTQRFT